MSAPHRQGLPPASDSTAICERPLAGLGHRLPEPKEEPEDIPQVLPVAHAPGELVRQYEAPDGETPPEVRALGNPERVHHPHSFVVFARGWRAVFITVGVCLALGLLALAFLGLPRAPLLCGFLFPAIAGGVALASWLFAIDRQPTYAVCREALVIIEDDDFIVIPWSAIVRLDAPRSVVTADDQSFDLAPYTEDLARLCRAVYDRVAERLLPPVLSALEREEPASFGPLTFHRWGLAYNGKKVCWAEISQINLSVNPRSSMHQLFIFTGLGLWPWACVNLSRIPNGWLLREVFHRICPPRLLARQRS